MVAVVVAVAVAVRQSAAWKGGRRSEKERRVGGKHRAGQGKPGRLELVWKRWTYGTVEDQRLLQHPRSRSINQLSTRSIHGQRTGYGVGMVQQGHTGMGCGYPDKLSHLERAPTCFVTVSLGAATRKPQVEPCPTGGGGP